MLTIEQQYEQCRRWAEMLRVAGFTVYFNYTGDPEPFDREWQVWSDNRRGNSERVATIDIDGCGASWHGPDSLWLRVIGPKEGVTA